MLSLVGRQAPGASRGTLGDDRFLLEVVHRPRSGDEHVACVAAAEHRRPAPAPPGPEAERPARDFDGVRSTHLRHPASSGSPAPHYADYSELSLVPRCVTHLHPELAGSLPPPPRP